MSKRLAILVLGLCLSAILPAAPVEAQTLDLEGRVTNGSSRPVAGLTVFLVHPAEGRSFPRITDANGRYAFQNVPLVGDEYYLEVYWGDELMYRAPVLLHRGGTRHDVVLD